MLKVYFIDDLQEQHNVFESVKLHFKGRESECEFFGSAPETGKEIEFESLIYSAAVGKERRVVFLDLHLGSLFHPKAVDRFWDRLKGDESLETPKKEAIQGAFTHAIRNDGVEQNLCVPLFVWCCASVLRGDTGEIGCISTAKPYRETKGALSLFTEKFDVSATNKDCVQRMCSFIEARLSGYYGHHKAILRNVIDFVDESTLEKKNGVKLPPLSHNWLEDPGVKKKIKALYPSMPSKEDLFDKDESCAKLHQFQNGKLSPSKGKEESVSYSYGYYHTKEITSDSLVKILRYLGLKEGDYSIDIPTSCIRFPINPGLVFLLAVMQLREGLLRNKRPDKKMVQLIFRSTLGDHEPIYELRFDFGELSARGVLYQFCCKTIGDIRGGVSQMIHDVMRARLDVENFPDLQDCEDLRYLTVGTDRPIATFSISPLENGFSFYWV